MQWQANEFNVVVWVLGFFKGRSNKKETDSDWPHYFLIIDGVLLIKYLGGHREMWLGNVVIFKETEWLAIERHLRNLITHI